MTTKPELLAQIIALLGASDLPRPTSPEAKLKIHNLVDVDLANAIKEFIHTRFKTSDQPVSVGTVTSTLAFMLADEIANTDFTGPTDLCRLAGIYGDYLHDAAHAIHDEVRAEREETGAQERAAKPDLEK